MKNRNLPLLIASLGISSGTLLINKLLIRLPDYLSIILIICSFTFLMAFAVRSVKDGNNK